jgi:hypothetical protein
MHPFFYSSSSAAAAAAEVTLRPTGGGQILI